MGGRACREDITSCVGTTRGRPSVPEIAFRPVISSAGATAGRPYAPTRNRHFPADNRRSFRGRRAPHHPVQPTTRLTPVPGARLYPAPRYDSRSNRGESYDSCPSPKPQAQPRFAKTGCDSGKGWGSTRAARRTPALGSGFALGPSLTSDPKPPKEAP